MFSIRLERHVERGWTGCSSSVIHHQQGTRLSAAARGAERRSVCSLMDRAQRAVGSMDSHHWAKSAELTSPMDDRHRTGRSKIWLAGRVCMYDKKHKDGEHMCHQQGRHCSKEPELTHGQDIHRCRNLDLTLATSSALELQKFRSRICNLHTRTEMRTIEKFRECNVQFASTGAPMRI